MAEHPKRASIEFMLKQFKPERYAYLAVTIASFLLLLVCIILLLRGRISDKNLGYIAGMVGSGGAIAYTASQLLRMWRDCMNLLMIIILKMDKNRSTNKLHRRSTILRILGLSMIVVSFAVFVYFTRKQEQSIERRMRLFKRKVLKLKKKIP